MRAGTKLFLGTSLGFSAGVGVTIALQRIYRAGGFLKDSLDIAFGDPTTPTKVLILVAAGITLVALPFGILEWRSDRRFLRVEREMRVARPFDQVSRYEGPEGRGFLFEGAEARTLLIEPTGGIGEPRVVELPLVPPSAPSVEPASEPSDPSQA